MSNHPQRRQKHGDRPAPGSLQWDDAVGAAQPQAAAAPSVKTWQERKAEDGNTMDSLHYAVAEIADLRAHLSRQQAAPAAIPEAFIDFWQLMVEHGQFDGAHSYGVFYERHAKSLHKALLAAAPTPTHASADEVQEGAGNA